MTKPGKQNQKARTAQEFNNSPFRSLKGVVVEQPTPLPKPVTPPPMPPATPADDTELFMQAVSGVQRLHASGKAPAASKAAPTKTRTGTKPLPATTGEEQRDDTFLQEIQRLKLDARFADDVPNEDELQPLAGNRLRQIKRGIVTVNRQLDLHGLTRDEALEELARFLKYARQKGEKAVLVITGKGNHSTGEAVLQQAVAAWLTKAGKELVAEFAPAPREMGGSGAYVVFLKLAPSPAPPESSATRFKQ